MKSIPSQFNHSLRRVIPASLAAGILILASTASMRAQSLILQMPNLIAEGTRTYPAAWIENPQIQTGGIFGEPSILSLSISLPPITEVTIGPRWYGMSMGVTADFPPSPPGQYDVVATSSGAAWRAEQLAAGADADDLDAWLFENDLTLQELTVTKQLTVVGLTGITADRYHVADGDTITLTAAMTPVNAFEFIYWDGWGPFCQQIGGGTYQKQMTRYNQPQTNGVVAVTAFCGTKTVAVPITVYLLTNVTASSNLITTADPVTLTAQFDPDPGTNNLGVSWFESIPIDSWYMDIYCGSGHSITISNLWIGQHTFHARCGSEISYASVTVNFGGTIALSATLEDIPIMTSSFLTATLTPSGTPNRIEWKHPEHQLSDLSGGLTRDYFFQHSGTQPVTVTCDGITATKDIRVYEVTGLSANPSLVAVGSNITFTATLYGGTNPPPLTWVVDGAVDTNSTGLTLTNRFPTAGLKTVTVWCGPSSSNSITVTNVGVDAIEFFQVTSETVSANGATNFGGVWEATSSPAYLLTGRTAGFRVRSSPAGAPWPTGAPVWNGTAGFSGTGETVSGAGSTLSANLTDFKTIQVTCGNTSNLLNAIVFDFTNQFRPQLFDDFPGRSHDEYGVAELINITPVFTPIDLTGTIVGGIIWSYQPNHIWQTTDPSEISGISTFTPDAATFQAGAEGETITIRAILGAGPSAFGIRQRQLPIIEPTGAVLKALKFALPSLSDVVPDLAVYHIINTASCVRTGMYFLTPTNVSFRSLWASEGGGMYTTTEMYTNGNLPRNSRHAEGIWGKVRHLNGYPNYFLLDRTGITEEAKFILEPPGGNLVRITQTVNIPILRMFNSTIYTNGTIFSLKTIEANGTVSISKGELTATKAFTDPTSP